MPALAFALAALLSTNGCRMNETNQTANANTANTNAAAPATPRAAGDPADPASVHRDAILIDMHADTVQRMIDEGADINERLADGHLDAVRARAGGLDAQFFSIWVEPAYFGAGGASAVERADKQIAAVRALASQRPDLWVLATSADDVRRAAQEGKTAALLGLEGGYALDERVENVRKYFDLGVRYISPTWTVSTSWAGSSGDAAGQSRGLNDFGKEVVREMNRLGIMVDVSHVSDKTFWDIVETSRKPVIASHSAVRAIVPHARNLTDDQIRALAKTGGVVSVVFYPAFIEPGWDEKKFRVNAEIAGLIAEGSRGVRGTGPLKRIARDRVRTREYAKRMPRVSAARIADHIDHIVRLVGVDHVGLGSDFDGIQAVPADLATVEDFPNLTKELMQRGYTADDVRKILGGNILRVMEEVAKK